MINIQVDKNIGIFKMAYLIIVGCLMFSQDQLLAFKDGIKLNPPGYSIKLLQDPNDINDYFQSGEEAKKIITFKNTGKYPVKINKVFLQSCGCSSGVQGALKIMPGEQGRFSYSINTTSLKSGLHVDQIIIQTEDKKSIFAEGNFHYTIKRDVLVSPLSINLGITGKSESFKKHINITINCPDKPDNVSFSTNQKGIDINLMEYVTNSTIDRHKYNLRIEGKTPDKYGAFQYSLDIILKSFQGKDRLFKIPIKGTVTNGILCKEKHLFIGYIKSEMLVHKQINILYPPEKSIKLLSCEVPDWIEIKKEKHTSFKEKGRLCIDLALKAVKIPSKNIEKDNVKITGIVGSEKFEISLPLIYVSKQISQKAN